MSSGQKARLHFGMLAAATPSATAIREENVVADGIQLEGRIDGNQDGIIVAVLFRWLIHSDVFYAFH